ncbi:hypothetical protein ABZZ79_35055 [Streptomyces sp. NPDC006458]|uniref:hypothetical protein n=1 Tax=Streptomyces sp. NPDC006458 TaxID=3154302 RepID=UPI0033B039F9
MTTTTIAGAPKLHSSAEYYVAAAALAARLGLPGPSADAVRACRDKAVQRRTLAEAGVPVPRVCVAGEVAEAVAAAQWLGGGPVAVEPVQGSGGLGVRLCRAVPSPKSPHKRGSCWPRRSMNAG